MNPRVRTVMTSALIAAFVGLIAVLTGIALLVVGMSHPALPAYHDPGMYGFSGFVVLIIGGLACVAALVLLTVRALIGVSDAVARRRLVR